MTFIVKYYLENLHNAIKLYFIKDLNFHKQGPNSWQIWKVTKFSDPSGVLMPITDNIIWLDLGDSSCIGEYSCKSTTMVDF